MCAYSLFYQGYLVVVLGKLRIPLEFIIFLINSFRLPILRVDLRVKPLYEPDRMVHNPFRRSAEQTNVHE